MQIASTQRKSELSIPVAEIFWNAATRFVVATNVFPLASIS
jgi:hypothetical protein